MVLLVVSANGTVNVIVRADVIVRTDEIGPAKARWWMGAYYSVSAPAYLRCVTTFLGGCCGTVAKVKGTALMVGGWKEWVKEEKMTGRKSRLACCSRTFEKRNGGHRR